MRVIVYYLVIVVCLSGCVNRTEFGAKRPMRLSKYKAPVDPVVYRLIDTAALYQHIPVFTEQNPKPTYKYPDTYLKFYADGRVGTFHILEIEEAYHDVNVLNPKRASVGYYKYTNKGLVIRTNFEHPQGGGFINHDVVTPVKDTLTSIYHNYDKLQYSYYKKIKLPTKLLIFKPDW